MKSVKHTRRAIAMAATLLFAIVFSIAPFKTVRAEEGMFLPDAISTLPLDKLVKRGMKIKPKDLYDPNGVSIKDAIVLVGGGTGEFVSPDGLLLTNHHVAFDALVAASTETKNYGETGYTAMSREQELPAQGYTVSITQELKDVTAEVLADVKAGMSQPDRTRAIQNKTRAMEADGSNEAESLRVRVQSLNDGMWYYKFTYLVLNDVRVVYAPPKSIGFYGGDDDNFEWPRHCGDFTFMRAYVGPDGKPADYSSNNVPYKPKKFLPISAGGIKEGDLALVMGYPGSTRRYRESYSVAYNQDIFLPFQVELFSTQIEQLVDAGKRDPELAVKLQSTLADLNNTMKNYAGSVVAMRRESIVDKKRASEAEFTKWTNADAGRKAKYGDVLPNLEKAYTELNQTALHDLLLNQIFGASDLLGIAYFAQQVAENKEKPEGQRSPLLGSVGVERARAQIANTLENRTPTVEREFLAYMLRKADELPPNQKISVIEKRFGHLKGEARRRAEDDFAREVVDSKRFATVESLSGLFDMSLAQLRGIPEPLVMFANELGSEVAKSQARTQRFNSTVLLWRPLLTEGMSAMSGTKPYPDANRTLRFTYGEVKGYVPREAISYTPFTTLGGVLEKDTGRDPFNAPEKLKQLYRTKDFGSYGVPGGRDVPVDFLSTTDIIGGNSGSPVLNGRGEQVGIVFDGNYEGLGNDFFYNSDRNRTISVDIRYVLFVTDKFGGAGWILKELDIRNQVKSK
jgi:hypothetical protein